MQLLAIEHTLGRELAEDSWHNQLVRTHLTKNMDAVFLDVREEVADSLGEYIVLRNDGAHLAPPYSNSETS